jgi:hypothetical protein
VSTAQRWTNQRLPDHDAECRRLGCAEATFAAAVALVVVHHHNNCKLKGVGSRQCRWWDAHLKTAVHMLNDLERDHLLVLRPIGEHA